jgi:guanine nucleotide-binding protein G(I)/G(S)/G(T) subunit beta-1
MKQQSIRARLRAAKLELLDLKIQVQSIIEATEKDLDAIWLGIGEKESTDVGFEAVRELRGHYGKVCAIAWCDAPDKWQYLASAGQDAKLLLWNAELRCRVASVSLEYAWVMTGAVSGDAQRMCAGGLDNAVSLYNICGVPSGAISNNITGEVATKLKGHDGYVSDCKFIGQDKMLTASGDATCALWDLTTGTIESRFEQHDADVQGLAISPINPAIFATASCDSLVRMLDTRDANKIGVVIRGHEGDVNDVCIASCGNVVCSASDDTTCRMNDVRTSKPLSVFSSSELAGVACTSVAISKSSHVVLSGHDDASIIAWKTTSADL